MANALTSNQLEQIISNTVAVLLARPDLLPDWHANLFALLKQTQESHLEDEELFVAAVLALIHSPEDTLPTGTAYDNAWQAILTSLQTGVIQSAEEDETATIKRLLQSVAEAVVAVQTRLPEQKDSVIEQVHDLQDAAVKAEVDELVRWLDDILKVLDGQPPEMFGNGHTDVYAAYWEALVESLTPGGTA